MRVYKSLQKFLTHTHTKKKQKLARSPYAPSATFVVIKEKDKSYMSIFFSTLFEFATNTYYYSCSEYFYLSSSLSHCANMQVEEPRNQICYAVIRKYELMLCALNQPSFP